MSVDLQSKAMIAKVSIKGIWSAVGEDSDASRDLARQRNISEDVYRAMKKICDPRKIPSLKEFNTARSTLYNLHRKMTLAWDDKGGRLLPTGVYSEYMTKVAEAKDKVIDTYTIFVKQIPMIKSQFATNPATAGAYREEDWPNPSELLEKVDIRVRIQPLADASHFLCKIGDDEERKIKEQIEKDLFASLAGGLSDLVGRLKQVVVDSQQSISNYATDSQGKTLRTFRDSAITNIREMVGNARKLNVIGDPTLNGILNELERTICMKDPQVLRDNFIERAQVVSQADAIAKKLAGIESILGRQSEAA